MSHVVLLGDAILDNGVHVAPDPDVIRPLRSELPTGWSATLLGLDGHVAADMLHRQLPRLPSRAAFARGFDLIDLRHICDWPKDYADPIEPSARGGAKVASAIAACCSHTAEPASCVWLGRGGLLASGKQARTVLV